MEEVISNQKDILSMLKTFRDAASKNGHQDEARHLSIAITDLEKFIAYLEVYLNDHT